MAKDHTGCTRKFTQLSRAWYSGSNLPDGDKVEVVTVGLYHHEGGTTGEFQISWSFLGGKLVPELSAFDDSWGALLQFRDLLESMAGIDDKNIEPNQFCELLISLDIVDATQTKR